MDNQGVSSVELSIAIAVALLTFAILFYVTFTLQTNVNIASGLLGMSEKGRLAVNYISQDIREAKAVRSSYGSYSTGGDTLILDVPSIDGSGNISFEKDNQSVLLSGNLIDFIAQGSYRLS